MAFAVDNKRIARNTMMLYIRTILVMLISLYMSRIILEVLGINDYAIYQVVGGMVSMFSIISSSLSVSISRHITYEIGHGDKIKLRNIFSTAVTIQIFLAIIVAIACEIISIWFIDSKMQVPPDKVIATKWVLQCTIVTFCFSLLSVPYNACIVAHERMKAFAYVSLLDVSLKLGACFLLKLFSADHRLVGYAILLMVIAICIRAVYSIYCYKNFEECRGKLHFNKPIFKEMISFSAWSFFSNTTSIVNNQGVTMLINHFFGLTYNAARGLASQVEGAVMQFVSNFTMAINPQITKSYAAGNLDEMYGLICRGAKFSYYAMLFFSLPLILEMKPILALWLKDVPEHTAIFAQLTLIMGMCDSIGSSGYTACMATGKLRNYALIVTPVGCLEFVFSWVLFVFGAPAVSSYFLYILVKVTILIVRMILMEKMIGLPIKKYMKQVFYPVICTSFFAIIIPISFKVLLPDTVLYGLCTVFVALISVVICVFFIGLTNTEKQIVSSYLNRIKHK